MKQAVLLLGGSGFIGRHLANQLSRQGYGVTIPSRQREHAREKLIILPNVQLIQADIHDQQVLESLLQAHLIIINLVGILHGDSNAFQRAHVQLTEKIVHTCEAIGKRRYLHMSALGADPLGPSNYLRSKGQAEYLVKQSSLDWTIMRPSAVFGNDDQFLNVLAKLLHYSPLLPLVAATSKLQPIWVEDVARAFIISLSSPQYSHQSLNLVGPNVYTLLELALFVRRLTGKRRMIIALPDKLARIFAIILQQLPQPWLSLDNLDSMRIDNIDLTGFPALLGFQPSALETVLPNYLGKTNLAASYPRFRSKAHR